MRGFVLAAGFGTRMRPLTDHIPKALVPVCGMTLLERALRFIYENGIEKIGVNTHYLPEQLQVFQRRSSVPFELLVESGIIRGTGGAFDYAREFLSGDDSFFMLNVDIVCQFDLKTAIRKFTESDSICTLIAFPCEHGKGTILFDNTTKGYSGTPSEIKQSDTMGEGAFIGAALYKKTFLDMVTRDDFSIVPVWKRAVDIGHKVTVNIQNTGYWRDIGTVKALADIHFECIDNALLLDIPQKISCVRADKICIPSECVSRKSALTGKYAWVESCLFDGSTVTNSIVWSDTDIRNKHIENSLYTPYGVISIS